MAHLADENGHTGTYVVEIKAEGHLIALGVKSGDVFLDLVTGNEEIIQLPFKTHEENTILTVDILVEVDDVPLVVGDEFGHFRDDALLVGAVQKQYGSGSHLSFLKIQCKGTNNRAESQTFFQLLRAEALSEVSKVHFSCLFTPIIDRK